MIKFDILGTKELRAKEAFFKKQAAQFPKRWQGYAETAKGIIEKAVIEEAPEGKTGDLKKGITVKAVGTGLVYSFTVKSSVPYDKFVRKGTKPHDIRPKGKRLKFSVGGQVIFAGLVHHPGTKKNDYVKRASDKVKGPVRAEIAKARKDLLGK